MPTSPQVGESMQIASPNIIVATQFAGCCMCDPNSPAINASPADYAAARNHLARLIQEKSHTSSFHDVGVLPNPPASAFDCTLGGLFFNNYKMRALQNPGSDETTRRESVASLVTEQHGQQHLAQRLERLSLGQLFLGGPVITLTDVDGPAGRKVRSNSEADALDLQARRFLNVPQTQVADEPMRPPM